MTGVPEQKFPAHVIGTVERRRAESFHDIVALAIEAGLHENRSWRIERHLSFAGEVDSDEIFSAIERVEGIDHLYYAASLRMNTLPEA